MANPKGKHGHSRTAKRRATWKLESMNLVPCPQCHQLKQPHRVCAECGYYAGREVVASTEQE